MDNATQRKQSAAGAVLMAVHALAEAIRGLGQVPAGHLYAQVMNRMSQESFDSCIKVLVGAGLVRRESNHLLTWIGPQFPDAK